MGRRRAHDRTELGRYNCLGSIEAEGFATLEPKEGQEGAWEASWIGPTPLRATNSAFVRLAIDDRTLGGLHSRQDIATTYHEMVMRDYADMCSRTGKGVARFVLP